MCSARGRSCSSANRVECLSHQRDSRRPDSLAWIHKVRQEKRIAGNRPRRTPPVHPRPEVSPPLPRPNRASGQVGEPRQPRGTGDAGSSLPFFPYSRVAPGCPDPAAAWASLGQDLLRSRFLPWRPRRRAGAGTDRRGQLDSGSSGATSRPEVRSVTAREVMYGRGIPSIGTRPTTVNQAGGGR